MRRYLLRRLMLIPVTLLGITFVVFCLSRMVPGGPVERMLQEQAMGALAGEKAGATPQASSLSEEDMERLEDLFNLREPMWRAYLQWLGLLPRHIAVARAELPDAEGSSAALTLRRSSGEATQVRVSRRGSELVLPEDAWLQEEGWVFVAESPEDRARQWARRNGREEDEALIASRAQSPECRHWRAVAYRESFDGLLQGNLGRSYKYNESVVSMMARRLPVSVYLGVLAALITYAVSVPLGVLKALTHKRVIDALTSVLIFVGYAVPGFALGALMLVYLGARQEWFPLYGLTSPDFARMGLAEQVSDLASHTVLPLLCYVVSAFAMTTMMMKNSLMEQISADYVRTAVSKGVSFRRAVVRHAFRNAFIPIASTLGTVLCTMVGGSVLIERVFDIPGFGLLSYQALMDKDYSLIMGTLLLSSLLIIVGNLLSDILVACLDPRIRYD